MRDSALDKSADVWYYSRMDAAKITISLDQELLHRLERLVQSRRHLAQECVKLDPLEEQALADVGLASEVSQWPPY
jgi:hypothetical protein